MNTKRCAFAMLATSTLASTAAWTNDFSIDWHTIDGGGGYSLGGDFELEGTIGQHDAGPGASGMTGGDFALVGGFWPGAGETVILPGDCNGDGHVALDDYADFALCLQGPGGTVGEGCDCFDLDGDAHVDLGDAAALLAVYTGD